MLPKRETAMQIKYRNGNVAIENIDKFGCLGTNISTQQEKPVVTKF